MTDRGVVKTDKQCRTSVSNIYAIGDIVDGPPLAHKASYEGKIAAEAIAGEPAEIDYLGIPAVVFSEPELATVGYTEAEAKKKESTSLQRNSHSQQTDVHFLLTQLMAS